MKILHVSFGISFTLGTAYQDNLLIDQYLRDGHEVLVIANSQKFKNGGIVEVDEEDRVLENGARFVRLKYRKIAFKFISDKVRAVKNLYSYIEKFSPEVIFFHGSCSWELNTVAKYIRKNKSVTLYADSHADYYTSGLNLISKMLLHGVFYRNIIQFNLKDIKKMFYISVNCGEFMKNVYNVPEDRMEFYPLGGDISTTQERIEDRRLVVNELNFSSNYKIAVHAGKLDSQKKTLELLKNFVKADCKNLKLLIIGSVDANIAEEFNKLIKENEDIIYLGWKTGDELKRYLNACDVYLQPGKVSATAQNALCSGCAVVLQDLMDYKPFVKKNGWLIKEADKLECIFKQIEDDSEILIKMSKESDRIANKYLDNKKLAARIYKEG